MIMSSSHTPCNGYFPTQSSFSSWHHNPKPAQVWNYEFSISTICKISHSKINWIMLNFFFSQNIAQIGKYAIAQSNQKMGNFILPTPLASDDGRWLKVVVCYFQPFSVIFEYKRTLQSQLPFLVADTRLYTLPCQSVGRYVTFLKLWLFMVF